MRIFVLCCIFYNVFFLSSAFAIKDFILRHHKQVSYSRFYFRSYENANYPYPLQSIQIDSDEYNFFYYTDHFRIIAGNYYQGYISVQDLLKTIGNIAETVWQKEVEELGFKHPKNSNKFYIDIYIANKDAYNPAEGEYISISSNYAGYAATYFDGTPYFVINPTISTNILKITLAHEFFHTIQFSYYDFLSLNDSIYNTNVWWLEATAVWMERVVFPEIDDYVTFINSWVRTCNYDITTYNGDHEYGESVIPIYLYSQNATATLEMIKQIFKNFANSQNFVELLNKYLPKFFNEKTLAQLIGKIASCIANRKCFDFANNLSQFPIYEEDNLTIKGYYALYPFYFLGNNVFAENPFYALYLSDSQLSFLISEIPQNKNLIYRHLPLKNSLDWILENSIQFSEKWNLLSNPCEYDIDPTTYFDLPSNYVIWTYHNGNWLAWSDNEKINSLLQEMGILSEEKVVKANSGFWLLLLYETTYNWSFENHQFIFKTINANQNWNLVSLGVISIHPIDLKEILQHDFIIWTYEAGKWKFFSSNSIYNSIAENYQIDIVDWVGRFKGYWLKILN